MASNRGAAILEKLAADDAARKQQQQKRREKVSLQAAQNEDVPRFLEAFRTAFQDADAQLLALAQASNDNSSGKQQTQDEMRNKLEDISSAVNPLEKQLADAAYFLPSYDLRQATASIADIKARIESLRESFAPKRKFTFSKKVNRVKASIDPDACSIAAVQLTGENNGSASQTPPATISPTSTRGCLTESQIVIRSAEDVQDADQIVEDLENCTVFILGTVPALRLRRLTNCQIYTGAVTGATFIDKVNCSIVMLASYQVRIHTSQHTDFYLRTRSRPIIEHCSGVRFAPYVLPPSSSLCDQVNTEFMINTTVWSEVEDFNWIKSAQSPNWSLLPEGERVGPATLPSP